MKFVMYAVLLTMEYCLAKLIFLVLEALVFNDLAVFLGAAMCGAIAIVMVALWRFGVRSINGGK